MPMWTRGRVARITVKEKTRAIKMAQWMVEDWERTRLNGQERRASRKSNSKHFVFNFFLSSSPRGPPSWSTIYAINGRANAISWPDKGSSLPLDRGLLTLNGPENGRQYCGESSSFSLAAWCSRDVIFFSFIFFLFIIFCDPALPIKLTIIVV